MIRPPSERSFKQLICRISADSQQASKIALVEMWVPLDEQDYLGLTGGHNRGAFPSNNHAMCGYFVAMWPIYRLDLLIRVRRSPSRICGSRQISADSAPRRSELIAAPDGDAGSIVARLRLMAAIRQSSQPPDEPMHGGGVPRPQTLQTIHPSGNLSPVSHAASIHVEDAA
jgi:hypothetical protein